MSEEQETKTDGEAEGDGKKPKSKLKLILVAVAAILVLGGGGAGAYFFLMAGGEEETAETDDHHHEEELKAAAKEAAAEKEKHVVMPFREIIVNITSLTARGKETSRFLKLNLAIVYDPAEDGSERLAERQIYIRDSYVEYLRQLNETDLRGSAGLSALKTELLHRARLLSDSDAAQELLIADLVIQ